MKRIVPISIVSAMLLLIAGYWINGTGSAPNRTTELTIATGPDGGMYQAFGTAIEETADEPIRLIESGGSSENLRLLREGEVEFALVQNDLAQYAKMGIRGHEQFDNLSYVLPVFPEYVQVLLPRESTITVLSELRGQSICIGQLGSGTYFNSLDILAEAGLRETVDFFSISRSPFDCLEDIGSGADIAAVFLTSNRLVELEDERFRQLYFSDSIANALAQQFPYFRVVGADEMEELLAPDVQEGSKVENVLEEREVEGTQPTPSGSQLVVDAYIATTGDEPSEQVAKLTATLLANWGTYQSKLPNLQDIDIPNVRETIGYHSAAQDRLVEEGFRTPNYFVWLIAAPWAFLLLLSVGVERWKGAYDRLGQDPFEGDWRSGAVRVLGFGSKQLILGSILIGMIWLAVLTLRTVEDYAALARQDVSPFAQMDMLDNFVWLFGYISSGFTSDNIYPVSYAGKVIVGALAIAGLAGPVGVILYFVSLTNKRNDQALRGRSDISLKDHVLLCGWNEKAKGIIFTLTGENVENPMKVVLVAEMEETYPLAAHKFDESRVKYCKGKSSDINTLKKANAGSARAAIILAEFGDNVSHNKQGILAAMNVRNQNAAAHIVSEIEFDDNVDHYFASGCNSLIHSNHLILKLALTSLLSENLVDYLFDIITYHGQEDDQLHTIEVGKLKQEVEWDGTISSLLNDSLRKGVNVVGILEANRDESFGFRASFDEGSKQLKILQRHRDDELVADEDIIVYSARTQSRIIRRPRRDAADGLDENQQRISLPDHLSLVVFADASTLSFLKEQLGSLYSELDFVGIDTSERMPRTAKEIEAQLPANIDKVLILTSQENRANLDTIEDLNEIDSDTILLTRLVRQILSDRNGLHECPVIAEVGNIHNRDLIRSAGAQYVLPGNLFVERLLAKEAYDREYITRFVLSMMDLADGIHLHCHVVTIGDGFCGERFDNILATRLDGAMILGWRPLRADLKNKKGDFGFHYRTVFDERVRFDTANEGDVLIMLVSNKDLERRS